MLSDLGESKITSKRSRAYTEKHLGGCTTGTLTQFRTAESLRSISDFQIRVLFKSVFSPLKMGEENSIEGSIGKRSLALISFFPQVGSLHVARATHR